MNTLDLEQDLLPKRMDSDKLEKDYDDESLFGSWKPRNQSPWSRCIAGLKDLVHTQGQSFLVIFLSAVNMIFLVVILNSESGSKNNIDSPIVGLIPNAFERTMSIKTPYGTPNTNHTARDELWGKLQIDRGLVAVDTETVAKHGLPDTMVFPWDSNKRVYIINAYHQIHCLKLLYKQITHVNNGGSFTQYEHLVHCLDQLRQDVHCRADDNLYYIGDINAGHRRQCRDFGKLEQWALDHHACYSFEKPPKAGNLDVEAFANCRPDSPYLETMKNHFGFGDDYKPMFPPHEGPTFEGW